MKPVIQMAPADYRIVRQIYAALTLLGAPMELLALVGSWGDTLDDEDVLDQLEQWNAREEAALTIRLRTYAEVK